MTELSGSRLVLLFSSTRKQYCIGSRFKMTYFDIFSQYFTRVKTSSLNARVSNVLSDQRHVLQKYHTLLHSNNETKVFLRACTSYVPIDSSAERVVRQSSRSLIPNCGTRSGRHDKVVKQKSKHRQVERNKSL